MSAESHGNGAAPNAVPEPALVDHLRDRLGPEASLAAVTVASEGMSDDTWMVDAQVGDELERLVFRRYRSGGALREETSPERHYRILRGLHEEESVPVPEALWFESDPDVLGGPFFVMRRVPGRIVVPWSAAGREFLAEAGRGPFGEQFVRTLTEIHGVDWAGGPLGFLAEGTDVHDDAAQRLGAMREAIERYRMEPEPVLIDALGWLEANRPEQVRTSLVHGDYRTGNIVFGEERINAVLDWEFARVGDPAADLAWLLTRTNRMDSSLACYMLEPARVLELYESHAGWLPSEASLHFWEVMALVFNTGLWLSSGFNYANGHTTDLTLARWSFTLPAMRRMVLDALEGS